MTTAEAQILVQCFDQAELHFFEQARDLTVTLLKQWLTRYKFKDWVKTQTRGLPVDDKMREDRASEIAISLNDTKRWHSHSRGISMEVLRKDLNLRIEDFGNKESLSNELRAYYKLLTDYMAKLGHPDALHTRDRYAHIWEA